MSSFSKQAAVHVKPADMRGREGDVAFRVGLGEPSLIEPIDGAAGDEFDRHAGFRGEFFGHRIGNKIAPAAAPDADDKLLLRVRGHRNRKGKERE